MIHLRDGADPAQNGLKRWDVSLFRDNESRAQCVRFTSGMRYLVYQVERCPRTRTLHVQGYVAFRQRKERTAVMKELAPTAPSHFYCALAKKADVANTRYCTKEKSRVYGPWTYGEPDETKRQGARTDLAEACALVKSDGVKAVAAQMPEAFVKFHQGFFELEKQIKPAPPKVCVLLCTSRVMLTSPTRRSVRSRS